MGRPALTPARLFVAPGADAPCGSVRGVIETSLKLRGDFATMGKHGMILFGHGARDARWKEPFARLAAKLAAARGDAGPVGLAFLELMTPDLPAAVAAQAAAGCESILVVPVFFGQGGHVRRDLPEIVARCQAAHPEVRLRCAGAVGEDDAVLDAVVRYCLAAEAAPD